MIFNTRLCKKFKQLKIIIVTQCKTKRNKIEILFKIYVTFITMCKNKRNQMKEMIIA